jgi:hypothetical protein
MMQAIEFEAVVQEQSIPLPGSTALSPGQSVRVVVMYEPRPEMDRPDPHDDAIIRLARHPLVIAGFTPLSRDEAHAR